MSTNKTTRAFVQANVDMLDSKLLTKNEKWVFTYLKKYAGNKKTCYPSLSTLARDCELARSTVQLAINRLVEVGLIERFHMRSQNGGHTNNQYLIHDLSEIWMRGSEKEIREAKERQAFLEKEREALEFLRANGWTCSKPEVDLDPERDAYLMEQAREEARAQELEAREKRIQPKAPEHLAEIPTVAGRPEKQRRAKIVQITQPEDDAPRIPLEAIREQIKADDLADLYPDRAEEIDQIAEIACAAVNHPNGQRIEGQRLTRDQIRERLAKLKPSHVLAVIDKHREVQRKIRNTRAYLVSMLYNEPICYDMELANRIRADEAQRDAEQRELDAMYCCG